MKNSDLSTRITNYKRHWRYQFIYAFALFLLAAAFSLVINELSPFPFVFALLIFINVAAYHTFFAAIKYKLITIKLAVYSAEDNPYIYLFGLTCSLFAALAITGAFILAFAQSA